VITPSSHSVPDSANSFFQIGAFSFIESFPNLEKLNIQFFVAVNHKYATDSVVIGTNDEIALIPPVSGG